MNIRKQNPAFTLIELLVVITIIGILAGIALPVYSTIQERGEQTKALSNAKQVGLALKLWAGDNGGRFVREGQKYDDGTLIGDSTNSNDFLKALIPTYVPSENVFAVGLSAWTPTQPDEQIATLGDRLRPGENHWAYVKNLTETTNPRFPLIADGFSETTVGQYTTDQAVKGGTWKGRVAVVIRVDQSGALERCNVTGTTSVVSGPIGAATDGNIFSNAPTWLSTAGGQAPVNPQ